MSAVYVVRYTRIHADGSQCTNKCIAVPVDKLDVTELLEAIFDLENGVYIAEAGGHAAVEHAGIKLLCGKPCRDRGMPSMTGGMDEVIVEITGAETRKIRARCEGVGWTLL